MLLCSTANPITPLDFNNVKVVTIYMGDTCNFDCVYCDRGYIKDTIGGSTLRKSDFDDIVSFIQTTANEAKELKAISFHGGEPFLFIKRIDKILERIQPMFPEDFCFFITTNGSNIPENEWFFKKWGKQIRITLSYDFMYQEINREKIDIKRIGEIIRDNGSGMLFQFVCPMDRESFDENSIATVISTMKEAHCNVLNLIPLRHYRGKDKFKVLVDDVDLKWFMVDLMRFIQTMYVQGIDINIDGNYEEIDKHYLDNHGKLILSPDGYIYPEFDYLEYKMSEFRTGQWKGVQKLYRSTSEDETILPACVECPSKPYCGLKYLYKEFGETPKGQCVEFYQIINVLVKHLYKLKTKNSLLHWIGYAGDE